MTPATHHWESVTPRLAHWWFFERSRQRGGDELVRGPGLVTGYSQECATCGIVRVFAPFYDDAGRRREVALYGFTWDALSPMRAPACEVLTRPALPEAMDVLEEESRDRRPVDRQPGVAA